MVLSSKYTKHARDNKQAMGQQTWTTWFNHDTWDNNTTLSAVVTRSKIVMMGATWCNTVRCSMMMRCNTMIGEGFALENQLKQYVFN